MLDIKLIRESPEVIKNDLTKRNDQEKLILVDECIQLDKTWRDLTQKIGDLRKQRNEVSQKINQLKKEGKDAAHEIKLAALIPNQIALAEKEQEEIKEKIDRILMTLPNILHESVPVGEGEEGNVTVEESGVKPAFQFTPKSHVDLLEQNDFADLTRAAKISGSRFWFLKGDLARLDAALQLYALDFMANKGYTIIQPPFMMHRDAYEGVVDLGDFEDVMYKVEGEDLYLIATSEHPLISQYANEILEETDMPIKLAGVSSCFRKEAGSHGKDTKGIFRGHQFNKVEQIVVCKPEDSWKLHEEVLANAKEFWESLEIPFRVVNICTGDIGTIAAKKYDIEAWMPAQNTYREVVSCSNCTDYQARRLRMRIRGKDTNILAHTLNSTCVATSRALVAILENNQNEDGTITVPKVLVPYMGNAEVIPRN